MDKEQELLGVFAGLPILCFTTSVLLLTSWEVKAEPYITQYCKAIIHVCSVAQSCPTL